MSSVFSELAVTVTVIAALLVNSIRLLASPDDSVRAVVASMMVFSTLPIPMSVLLVVLLIVVTLDERPDTLSASLRKKLYHSRDMGWPLSVTAEFCRGRLTMSVIATVRYRQWWGQ